MTITPNQREAIKGGGSRNTLIFGAIVIATLLIYAGYWVYVSRALKANLEARLAEGHLGAVNIAAEDLTMGGFPYRIEARLAKPKADAPKSPEKWSWTAQQITAELLPYDPGHVVLKIDGPQTISYTDISRFPQLEESWLIESEGNWASYVAEKGSSFGRLAVDLDQVKATRQNSDASKPVNHFSAGRLQLHTRPAEQEPGAFLGNGNHLDLALQGDDVSMDSFNALPFLGPRLTQFVLQARLRNVGNDDEPSPSRWLHKWVNQNGSLAISDLLIKWGPLDMAAHGELTLDSNRRPQGRLDAEIANYGELVKALITAGRITARDGNLAMAGLGLMSQFQGNEEGRINVPVIFSEGRIYLGPLVVAQLEPLY
ncbi:MAG: DUF2125 domain-containing protein [Rhizobiales bacterium]|nr:DUF2125 domain-containing protein [Hyphomicrobiales bacterium]